MRAIYDEERNTRSYPEAEHPFYSRGRPFTFFGPEITNETSFDECRINVALDGRLVGKTFLYNGGVKVTQVPGRFAATVLAGVGAYRYLRDDPEVQIIRERIRAGSCVVRYFSTIDGLLTREELHEAAWLTDLVHPFHADDRDLFFEHLTEDLYYTAPEHGNPQRFHFPGTVVDQRNPEHITRWKRIDSSTYGNPPAARFEGDKAVFLAALDAEGWLDVPPTGGNRLWKQEIWFGLNSDGIPFTASETPQDIRWIFINHRERIRAVAKEFAKWFNGLTPVTTDATAHVIRVWFRIWIGYAWELLDNDNSRTIWYIDAGGLGVTTVRRLDGNLETANWIIGHLEEWVTRGIEGLRNAMTPAIQSALEARHLLKIIPPRGMFGERLSTVATPEKWLSYQNSFWDAVGHNVNVVGPVDWEIDSGETVNSRMRVSVNEPDGDTTYAWTRVAGDGGSLSDEAVADPDFTAPTLEPHDPDRTITWQLEACNGGLCDAATETWIVRPPIRLTPDNLTPSVQAGQIANMQVTREGGSGPFTWAADVAAPDWATVTSVGVLKLAPGAEVAAGEYSVTVTCTDSRGTMGSASVTVTVTAATD